MNTFLEPFRKEVPSLPNAKSGIQPGRVLSILAQILRDIPGLGSKPGWNLFNDGDCSVSKVGS